MAGLSHRGGGKQSWPAGSGGGGGGGGEATSLSKAGVPFTGTTGGLYYAPEVDLEADPVVPTGSAAADDPNSVDQNSLLWVPAYDSIPGTLWINTRLGEEEVQTWMLFEDYIVYQATHRAARNWSNANQPVTGDDPWSQVAIAINSQTITPSTLVWLSNVIVFTDLGFYDPATVVVDDEFDLSEGYACLVTNVSGARVTVTHTPSQMEYTIEDGQTLFVAHFNGYGTKTVLLDDVDDPSPAVDRFDEAGTWERTDKRSFVFVDSTDGAFDLAIAGERLLDGDELTVIDEGAACETNPVDLVPAATTKSFSRTFTFTELNSTESPSFEYTIPEMDGKTFTSIVLSGTPFTGAGGTITAGIRTSGGAFYFPMTDVTDPAWDGTDITEPSPGTIAEPVARFEISGGGNFDATAGEVTFTFYYDETATINGEVSYSINTMRGAVTLVWDAVSGGWLISSSDDTVRTSRIINANTTLDRAYDQLVIIGPGTAEAKMPAAPQNNDIVRLKSADNDATFIANDGQTIDASATALPLSNGSGVILQWVSALDMWLIMSSYTPAP